MKIHHLREPIVERTEDVDVSIIIYLLIDI